MTNKKKHTALKVIGFTAAAGTAAYAGYGYYIFRNAFDIRNSAFFAELNGIKRIASDEEEKNQWFLHSVREDDFIDSYDGLKLHALRIQNNSDSHRWILMVHGIGEYSFDLLEQIWEADHRGFNILAVDSRGCGMSEGNFTGLGWNEHYDIISWINYLINMDPEAEIALYGQNVGAAAVMNVTGDYVPANVKCAIEDGGFSGVREILLYEMREKCRVDGKLFIPSIDLYVRNILHYSVNDISTHRQLKQSSTPTMFVHGSEDMIVPASMMFDNYYACSAEKELFIAEGKGFREASEDPDYYNVIFRFIDKYITQEEAAQEE